MQADSAQDVVINGINVFTAAGVQSVININPRELGSSDPGADVTFWCSCFDPCRVTSFTGTTSASSYYDGFNSSPMNKPTIIGGGGLNN